MSDLDYITKSDEEVEFGPWLEKSIISLAFEYPEFFETINQYMNVDFIEDRKVKFVYNIISDMYEEFNVVPTRGAVKDQALKSLTVDHPYQEYLDIIDKEIDPREVPIIKAKWLEWARHKAYGIIYSEDALDFYFNKEYDKLEQVIDDAGKVTDFGQLGFSFFDEFERIFIKEEITHYTSGFQKLDEYLNFGGPSPREVLCFLASTGVGKSIALVNTGVANALRGEKVLHVTCELSKELTAARYAACFTNLNINRRYEENEANKFREGLGKIKSTHNPALEIHEFPSDGSSVADIYALIDILRQRKRFVPTVIIIDYMDLLNSRVKQINGKDEYIKQKKVAVEIRALAHKTNALVVTATQTNRSGSDSKEQAKVIELDNIAESYGKTMALDYIVSMQQSKQEYDNDIPGLRFYIAKNRNGPKQKTIRARIKYTSMKIEEELDGEMAKINRGD